MSAKVEHGRSSLLIKDGRRHRGNRVVFISFLVLAYMFISTGVLVLYGPFESLRRTVIGAILTSSHPWVIKPFFSTASLKKYQPVAVDAMSSSGTAPLDFSNIRDGGTHVIPIQSNRYSGTLLVIDDPKRVHVAGTKYLNKVGETVSAMVKDAHGLAGINAGGFYDGLGHGTGGVPIGLTLSRGKYIAGDKQSAQPMIVMTKEGALVVGKYTYKQLQQLGVQDAVSFGPELVRNGKPYLTLNSGSWGIAPRSAIGQRPDGAILLLALSGRGSGGIGASLLDCENVMLKNGAYIAANLDGGYSTELYDNGKFLVAPSNPLGERYVATSFIVDGVNGS